VWRCFITDDYRDVQTPAAVFRSFLCFTVGLL